MIDRDSHIVECAHRFSEDDLDLACPAAGDWKIQSLDDEARRQLLDTYHQDTLKLQDLIRRDLSEWLT